MAIQTIEFGITPMEYYKIVATNRLKRSWWVYIGCFALAMISISDFGVKDLSTFLVIFGFIYPPLILSIYISGRPQVKTNQPLSRDN